MKQPSPKNRPWSQPLADLIGAALDPLLAKQGFGESDIILNWEEIAGERLAAVCEPIKLQWPTRAPQRPPDAPMEPATLVVRIEGAFALELQHLAPLLCERINTRLGWRCVGRIALRQGPLTRREPPRRAAPTVDPAALARAEAMTEGVEDEALKAALRRLGGHVLTRGPAKT